jgi:hypothetical protein
MYIYMYALCMYMYIENAEGVGRTSHMLPLGMDACVRRALTCRFGRVGARTG